MYFNESTLAVACEKSVLLYNVFRGNRGRPGSGPPPSSRPLQIDLSTGGDASEQPPPPSRRTRSSSTKLPPSQPQQQPRLASRGPLWDWSQSAAPAPEHGGPGSGAARPVAAVLSEYPLAASACGVEFGDDPVGCRAGGVGHWAVSRRSAASAGDSAALPSRGGGGGFGGGVVGVGGGFGGDGGGLPADASSRTSWLAIPSLLSAPAIQVDSCNRMATSAPPMAVPWRAWPQDKSADFSGKRRAVGGGAHGEASMSSATFPPPPAGDGGLLPAAKMAAPPSSHPGPLGGAAAADEAMPNLVDARCEIQ